MKRFKSAKPKSRVNRGTIDGLTSTENGIEFTWTAESLPWAIPAEAQQGAKLLKLGHRMSREALEVHGLPTGQYELTIDGQPVGVYSDVQRARHIELQANENTPQYQPDISQMEFILTAPAVG